MPESKFTQTIPGPGEPCEAVEAADFVGVEAGAGAGWLAGFGLGADGAAGAGAGIDAAAPPPLTETIGVIFLIVAADTPAFAKPSTEE